MNKKIGILILIMALAACVLWTGLRYLEHAQTGGNAEREGISRALAVKSLALGMTEKQNCLRAEGGYFKGDAASYWYVPYYNYLYQTDIISPEMFLPEPSEAAGNLTVEEAAAVWEILGLKELAGEAKKEEPDRPVSASFWWKGYQEFLDKYNYEGKVQEKKLLIYATPGNADSKKWQASTNEGIFGFEGLTLDANLDQVLKVWVRGDEILRLVETIPEDVVYQNIWISDFTGGMMTALVGGAKRSFTVDADTEMEAPCLADFVMENGKVKTVRVKPEQLSAKVLSVEEDAIELEGYGRILLDEGFQVYREEGEVKAADRSEILPGAADVQFYAEEGKLCAAMLGEKNAEEEPSTIRVLLENTDFTSYYHSFVTLEPAGSLKIENGNGQEWSYEAGETVRLDGGSEMFEGGNRLVVTPSEGEVGISSISRYQGTPFYGGTLELKNTEQGILIVNEVPLEEYLKKVVGSEMPASYGLEAAKIQAVCARSYACRLIEENSCREYGAHVTDSTEYQVYNNFASDPVSIQGVEETEGEVLRYQGEIIAAYYFSTSCGHTTDASVWGGDASAYPYLEAQRVAPSEQTEEAAVRQSGAEALRLESNFRAWLGSAEEDSYESGSQWYRWNTSVTLQEVQGRFEKMQDAGTAPDVEIGNLKHLEVMERAPGGAVTVLRLIGEAGEVRLEGQTAARTLLGDSATVYQTQTGKESVGEREILPSAFFYLEENWQDEKMTGYRIFGGGSGHGVGMSQNAAHGMIQAGMGYREILQYFYPGTDLEKLA